MNITTDALQNSEKKVVENAVQAVTNAFQKAGTKEDTIQKAGTKEDAVQKAGTKTGMFTAPTKGKALRVDLHALQIMP
jgi:preprotein translocase subunit SecD